MCSSRFLAMLTAASVILLTSCVERKEQLSISPNGSVYWRVEHASASMESLYDHDAVPRMAEGWVATEEVQKQGDGTERFRLIAERVFAPGEALPPNFALRTDSNADLYLQFPTAVRIEQRSDGMYYHFARRYLPRSWAAVDLHEERLVKLPLREFGDTPLHQWTPAQRLEAVRAFAEFETQKMLVFARAAFNKATPELPQDAWLLVRQHVLKCVEHYDYQKLADRLDTRESTMEEDMRAEAVRVELNEMAELAADQLKQAMFTVANCTGRQLNAFLIEYERQSKAYEITRRLAEHSFKIVVEMPGEVIASNADSVHAGTAEWDFDGAIVRDREFELLATSRVLHERTRR